jgi:hypothetical protein
MEVFRPQSHNKKERIMYTINISVREHGSVVVLKLDEAEKIGKGAVIEIRDIISNVTDRAIGVVVNLGEREFDLRDFQEIMGTINEVARLAHANGQQLIFISTSNKIYNSLETASSNSSFKVVSTREGAKEILASVLSSTAPGESNNEKLKFNLTKEKLHEIDELVREAKLVTRRDLFNTALTVFEWAMKEIKSGRILASIDEKGGNYQELKMSVFDTLAGK